MSPYRTKPEPDSEGYREAKPANPPTDRDIARHHEAKTLAMDLVDQGVHPWWSSAPKVWFDRQRSELRLEFVGVGRRESLFVQARYLMRALSSVDPLQRNSELASVLHRLVREHFAPLLRDVQPFQKLARQWFKRVVEQRRRTGDFRCPNCGLPARSLNHLAIKIERERDEFASTITTTFRCEAGEDG